MTSSTETEARLAALWRDVLGINDVTPEDDFFALGGNSLAAIRLLFRIHETFGAEVAIRDFYSAPTLADCARAIELHAAGSVTSAPRAINRIDRDRPIAPSGE